MRSIIVHSETPGRRGRSRSPCGPGPAGKLGLLALVGMAWLGPAVPSPLHAQASPYVPARDPAYDDLDALVAAGWVRDGVPGERPYTRSTMARMAVEARRRLAGGPVSARAARLDESLARLERALAPEIASLCDVRSDCPAPPRGVVGRSLSVEGTVASSRTRRIPSSYDFPNSDYIDADLNPLLQRNQGRTLADGGTLAIEGIADGVFGRRLAAQVRPRVAAMQDRAAGGSVDAALVDAYVRARFGDLAVDAGRLHVELGHGRDAGPVLSDNARGLDLVRVSLERPVRMPGFLRALGPFTASALVADMGADVDTPHSKLIVFHGTLRPHPSVELTATLLNQQGGRGAPAASWSERIQDIFLISPQRTPISDKVVAGGIQVMLPFARTRLYADVMTTDDHDLFTAEFGEALTTEAVWLWGARTTGMGPGGRFDLWAEAHVAGVRPHTHHQFTSGLTQDRRLIGDPLGPLGRSWAGGVQWRGATQRIALEVERERYGNGDLYQDDPTDERFTWTKTRDAPDEVRRRIVAEWRRDPRAGRIGVSARVGFERVDAFEFKPAARRANVLAQTRVEIRSR